ncbi:hypothetical protein DIPPA_28032 [Diplonema papillatum]|nr:hypothetical protein DIPPA_28032 [Diplonema papillatum]|eukprot:gene3306-5183_t
MSLPWSSYTPQGQLTFSTVVTPYGVVNVPVSADVVAADADQLRQDLWRLRLQMEGFFGDTAEDEDYSDDWWDATAGTMRVGPKNTLTLADVLTAMPQTRECRMDVTGCRLAYESVAKFLQQPGLWPAAPARTGTAILSRNAGDLVAAAAQGAPLSPETARRLTLHDFSIAFEHFLLINMPRDDNLEPVLMKVSFQLQHVLSQTDFSETKTSLSKQHSRQRAASSSALNQSAGPSMSAGSSTLLTPYRATENSSFEGAAVSRGCSMASTLESPLDTVKRIEGYSGGDFLGRQISLAAGLVHSTTLNSVPQLAAPTSPAADDDHFDMPELEVGSFEDSPPEYTDQQGITLLLPPSFFE